MTDNIFTKPDFMTDEYLSKWMSFSFYLYVSKLNGHILKTNAPEMYQYMEILMQTPLMKDLYDSNDK